MISELTPEHLTSAFRRLQRDVQLHNEHPQSSLSYENELVNLLNAQNLFISKLLQSQSLLYNHLMKNGESTETGGQNNEDFQEGKIRASGQSFYNSSSSDQRNFMQEKDRKPKKKAAHSPLKLTSAQKLQRKVVFEYEMDSSDSERPVMKHPEAVAKKKDVKKTTETKNIIKNYAKSILNFIKRNVQARRRLLRQFKIEETEFMKVHEQYKGNIHSISQLRSLWSDAGNQYSKIFRILSWQYLRRYSFEHIFNSRISNHPVHIKYRRRLLQSLRNPDEFTSLKIN